MKLEIGRLTVREPFKSLFPVEPDVVKALTADMKANGFDAARTIIAWKAPDGASVVVDGHMRLHSAKAARLNEVHVTVRRFTDEDAAFAFAVASQRDRRNLSKLEIAEAIARAETARSPADRATGARSVSRPRNAQGQLQGRPKDPVTHAVVTKAAKAGVSERTAKQALANVRAANGKSATPPKTNPRAKPRRATKETAPSPATAKHLPYPAHLHPLLEATAELTDRADLHLLVEHATYACLDLADGQESALRDVRAAVSAGARNYRNFNKLVDRTFGTTAKGRT